MAVSFQAAEWLARQEAANMLPEMGLQYMQLLGKAEASDEVMEEELLGWGQTTPEEAGEALHKLTYHHYQNQKQDRTAGGQQNEERRGLYTHQPGKIAERWISRLAQSQRVAIQGHWWRNDQSPPPGRWQHHRQSSLPMRAFQEHAQWMLEQSEFFLEQKQFQQAETMLLQILGASRSLAYSVPTREASKQALLIHHMALQKLDQLYEQMDRKESRHLVQNAQSARIGGRVLTLIGEAQQNLEGLGERGGELLKHPRVPAALKWDFFRAGRITQLCYSRLSQLDFNREDLRASLFREPGGRWIYRQLKRDPIQGLQPGEQPEKSFQECWTVRETS